MKESPASNANRRALNGFYTLSLAVVLIFMLFPVVSVTIAGVVANAGGCQLDEGSIHPCVIAGIDLGGTLYSMEVLGWFMLVTVPAGGLLLVCWTVALLARRGRLRRERSAERGVSR